MRWMLSTVERAGSEAEAAAGAAQAAAQLPYDRVIDGERDAHGERAAHRSPPWRT
jgi:hypothetical protein